MHTKSDLLHDIAQHVASLIHCGNKIFSTGHCRSTKNEANEVHLNQKQDLLSILVIYKQGKTGNASWIISLNAKQN